MGWPCGMRSVLLLPISGALARGGISGAIDDVVASASKSAAIESGLPVWAIVLIVVFTTCCGPCCIVKACEKAWSEVVDERSRNGAPQAAISVSGAINEAPSVADEAPRAAAVEAESKV
eukprot:scaffold235755_cov33-Tisochrysis_lutea.AAC.1